MMGFVVIPVLLHVAMASDVIVWVNEFIRCEDKDECSGPVLDTAIGVSAVQCASLCLGNELCRAVRVCPQAGSMRQVFCSLLENAMPSGNITANKASQNCFQMRKARCENGGTLVDGQCRCPMEFAGTSCQRRVRDCKEAADNGYSGIKTNTPLLIQPVSSPAPFWVLCRFDTGMTYPLKRQNGNFNVNWTTAKTSFGDLKSNDYFVGLDNLYYLLGQAEYQLNVYCLYNKSKTIASAFYRKFSIGNESSNYALAYQSFYRSTVYLSDNGFLGSLPLAFSTNDRDINSCRKGYPGWFSSNCTGYSLFADQLVWPIKGSVTNIDLVNMGLNRVSNFTID